MEDDQQRQLDQLIFFHDQLEAELEYLNELMLRLGFTHGLIGFKNAGEEIIARNLQNTLEN